MNTMLLIPLLALCLGLPLGCPAQVSKLDPKSAEFVKALRQDEAQQRRKELAAAGEKAVAALRADLAGPWTSVIVTLEHDCSCLAPEYRSYRLRREGGAVTVTEEPWCRDRSKKTRVVPRPISQAEVERLLAETVLNFQSATLSLAASEIAGPIPRDIDGQKEWRERYLAAGGSPQGGDRTLIDVSVSSPGRETWYHDMWADH